MRVIFASSAISSLPSVRFTPRSTSCNPTKSGFSLLITSAIRCRSSFLSMPTPTWMLYVMMRRVFLNRREFDLTPPLPGKSNTNKFSASKLNFVTRLKVRRVVICSGERLRRIITWWLAKDSSSTEKSSLKSFDLYTCSLDLIRTVTKSWDSNSTTQLESPKLNCKVQSSKIKAQIHVSLPPTRHALCRLCSWRDQLNCRWWYVTDFPDFDLARTRSQSCQWDQHRCVMAGTVWRFLWLPQR